MGKTPCRETTEIGRFAFAGLTADFAFSTARTSARIQPGTAAMTPADLIAGLRAAGDPLHLLARHALAAWYTEVERLHARALQLGKDSARGPSHVAGFVHVLHAVEGNLRSWSGKPVRLTGMPLAERFRWTEPSQKPVALPDR